MKQVAFVLFFFVSLLCYSQEQTLIKSLPSVTVKSVEGKNINTSQISNNGKPIIIVVWKMCCKLPGKELDAIADVYDKWVKETGVKLFAVSVDDSKTTNKVNPFANGKGRDFEILLDPNSDFKRAMNVVTLPHTFLLNGKGEIVWRKMLFNDGDENIIYDELTKIIK